MDATELKKRLEIGGEIERVNGKELSYTELVERYLAKNRPVILTGLMDDWRASKDWVDENGLPNLLFFSAHFANSKVQEFKLNVNNSRERGWSIYDSYCHSNVILSIILEDSGILLDIRKSLDDPAFPELYSAISKTYKKLYEQCSHDSEDSTTWKNDIHDFMDMVGSHVLNSNNLINMIDRILGGHGLLVLPDDQLREGYSFCVN